MKTEVKTLDFNTDWEYSPALKAQITFTYRSRLIYLLVGNLFLALGANILRRSIRPMKKK